MVTGGAGFIGSAVIRHLLHSHDCQVVNIDKLTYAGNLATTAPFQTNPKYHFEWSDVCDRPAMAGLFKKYQPKAIMHLAAESHVDRSIDDPRAFIQTNIVGTYNLLETARDFIAASRDATASGFRFHHVSTDEVFGTLGDEGLFTEDSSYQPNSPYAASKAAADHLVRAWHETFGLPVVLSNCCNNYGPCQHPEKFVPMIISRAVSMQSIPVYGTGDNVRDWLYVDDHAAALVKIMQHGVLGRSYNVGGHAQRTNLQVVKTVCGILDRECSGAMGKPYESLIKLVADRPGHDQRYAINASRVRNELGWAPRESFESGMIKTVAWYLHNRQWVEEVQQKNSRKGQCAGVVKRIGGTGCEA